MSETAFCTALSVASVKASKAARRALKSGAAASSRVMVTSVMIGALGGEVGSVTRKSG